MNTNDLLKVTRTPYSKENEHVCASNCTRQCTNSCGKCGGGCESCRR